MMPIILNKTAFQKLIDEDIDWLAEKTPRSLEREHIVTLLLYLRENYKLLIELEKSKNDISNRDL